jgi:predicted Zn-dependent peptidase
LICFCDAVLHPSFVEEQFKMEREKALSKLAAERMEPDSLAEKLSGSWSSALIRMAQYRTPETVQSIVRDDLVAYHKTHFLPNNATLAIVGDVKAGTIVPLIEKALAEWKRGEVVSPKLPKIAGMKSVEVHLVDRPGSVQSNIVVCMPGPPAPMEMFLN